ncbi:MAG: multicopper oxidase family protein [Burkholderiales bacterium]
MNRRKFLTLAAAVPLTAAGVYAFLRYSAGAKDFTAPLFIPGGSGPFGVLEPKDELTFVAERGVFPMAGGKTTPFLWYRVHHQGKDYQNPILKVRAGAQLSVTLNNALNEGTIIHWHGLHLPGKMDGHPRDTIGPGSEYRYAFTVKNRGGTYWYHTHADHLTAKQAYSGLASFFIVEDDDEVALREALDLQLGVTDLPLVIQDKRFNDAGEFVYDPNPMERMMGYLGDTILANLTHAPFAEIGTRIYRFRLLNGSNARIYKLAFVKGGRPLPYHVIGTDGGLLDKPYPVTEAFLAPGERLDVLLDAGGLAVGDAVFLRSLQFDPLEGGGMMGGMMGRMSSARLSNGQAFDIMKLAVTKRAGAAQRLPARLSHVAPIDTKMAAVRTVDLEMAQMRWLINGESYREDAYPIEVRRNTVEVWEIRNAEHSMPHPMHMHGFQFQVLSRRNSPAQMRALGGHGDGRVASDLGWKDTVLVWPGETVRLAVDFSHDFGGDQVYVFHCHNLEHEDGDMMVNMRVRA